MFRFVFAFAICLLPVHLIAEDVIVLKRSNNRGESRSRGTIVEWRGSSLTLLSNGKEREIDNERIIEVRSVWDENYLEGKQALARREFPVAIANLKQALRTEKREWAQQMIRARLLEAYLGVQDFVSAIQQFLAITQNDPQTRFFHLIPLSWNNSSFNASSTVPVAKRLVESKNIVARLIAASWMLNDTRDPNSRKKAIKILESLSNDIEPKIAQLATMQLWRTRVVTVEQPELDFWIEQTNKFDSKIRYGGRLVIAEAQTRRKQLDQAAVTYLSLPILHPEQHHLIPNALYSTGIILGKQNRQSEADLAWRELIDNYPETVEAKRAKNASKRLQNQN